MRGPLGNYADKQINDKYTKKKQEGGRRGEQVKKEEKKEKKKETELTAKCVITL